MSEQLTALDYFHERWERLYRYERRLHSAAMRAGSDSAKMAAWGRASRRLTAHELSFGEGKCEVVDCGKPGEIMMTGPQQGFYRCKNHAK